VLKWRRLHLKQQQIERDELDRHRMKARELGTLGNPVCCFMMIDAMTEFTTQTPRFGGDWQSKQQGSGQGAHFETRFFGCEVICGGIEGYFIYYTDHFVEKGANVMVEVQRQALADMQALLLDSGYQMPKELFLHYDNGRENKNKEMFFYLSLLVEEEHFDLIHVNFLIVGHTHSSIDQFFSVLSGHIKNQPFIGTHLMINSPPCLYAFD
jgi:hypothetical protein